jgi:hypothetical protein
VEGFAFFENKEESEMGRGQFSIFEFRLLIRGCVAAWRDKNILVLVRTNEASVDLST